MGRVLEMAIGALNGAVGDYLARTGNGLATPMGLVHEGTPLPVDRTALARAYPRSPARLVVLVHGLMCTEDIFTLPDGTDYGSLLARDLGFAPLYVRYNTGLPIPDNGSALAALLAELVRSWPGDVDEIVPVGFSMGGLVVRAACHTATMLGMGWLPHVRRAIYLGTPHLGAPLERVGRVVTRALRAVPDPYTRLAADLAELRSDGVKDLGDADLRHEDRARRVPRVGLRDAAHPVPLLPEVRHHLIAATLSTDPLLASLFGDTLVPVPSATDGRCTDRAGMALPPEHIRVLPGLGHVALAHDPGVYEHIRDWCADGLEPS